MLRKRFKRALADSAVSSISVPSSIMLFLMLSSSKTPSVAKSHWIGWTLLICERKFVVFPWFLNCLEHSLQITPAKPSSIIILSKNCHTTAFFFILFWYSFGKTLAPINYDENTIGNRTFIHSKSILQTEMSETRQSQNKMAINRTEKKEMMHHRATQRAPQASFRPFTHFTSVGNSLSPSYTWIFICSSLLKRQSFNGTANNIRKNEADIFFPCVPAAWHSNDTIQPV